MGKLFVIFMFISLNCYADWEVKYAGKLNTVTSVTVDKNVKNSKFRLIKYVRGGSSELIPIQEMDPIRGNFILENPSRNIQAFINESGSSYIQEDNNKVDLIEIALGYSSLIGTAIINKSNSIDIEKYQDILNNTVYKAIFRHFMGYGKVYNLNVIKDTPREKVLVSQEGQQGFTLQVVIGTKDYIIYNDSVLSLSTIHILNN